MRSIIRRGWSWTRASRLRRIASGTVGAFLVAGAAFAFYAAVLSGGSGDTSGTPFAAKGGPVQFKITAALPTGLQPGTTCDGKNPNGTTCASFDVSADNTANPNATAKMATLTLTGVDLPAGCPADSWQIIPPNGPATGDPVTSSNLPWAWDYTTGSYGTARPVIPGGGTADLFPSSSTFDQTWQGDVTAHDQPVFVFHDDGTDQSACAGGTVTMHWTAAVQ